MQTEVAECGLACLLMIANSYGLEMDLPSARLRYGTSGRGVNLQSMLRVAGEMGLVARPLRVELEYLSSLRSPCILHWSHSHFVVLAKVGRRGAEIFDPALGFYRMSLSEVSKRFTGILVELKPSSGFEPVDERRRISFSLLAGRIDGLLRSMAVILGLAFAIEVLGLVVPFQAQWALDEILLSQDVTLLWVVTAGFVLTTGILTALGIARAHVLGWFGASVNSQWSTNLFTHLLRMPLAFFERRHLGDIVSRFGSVRTIQTTLTGSFAESVLDGLGTVVTLALLIFYGPSLAAVVLAGLVTYGIARLVGVSKLRIANEEQIIYGARQQSELMESVRGIQSIKLGNKQAERASRMGSATLDMAEREMITQRISLTFSAINQGIFGLQRVMIVALGVMAAIEGTFTAGMLLAFVTYADQFSLRAGKLVDRFVELRMLQLHAERVADIALEEPEAHERGSWRGEIAGTSIEVRDLGFRYGQAEPWAFRGVNLKISEGEHVAISGPSGCGKSTLAKVLLGLLVPTEGTVLVGGVDIRILGMRRFRSMLAAVMQDDQLFAGSIAENIAFFDNPVDIDLVRHSAIQAMIHDDIMAMPMGYESLVGDMGSTLSGGQLQRVLIARALYAKPRILLLDEATSHLDPAREIEINRAIRQLQMTRISIAHRADTIASADRVFELAVCGTAEMVVPHAAADETGERRSESATRPDA